MKRLTAAEVAEKIDAIARHTFESGYDELLRAADIVRDNLISKWQDEPDEDTHSRCQWWWCEDCGADSPPQLLRCYRPLKATPHGNLTVDMQSPKEWSRWTVSGWVPLVGRVCSIGERPS